jgi:hypothetical protein
MGSSNITVEASVFLRCRKSREAFLPGKDSEESKELRAFETDKGNRLGSKKVCAESPQKLCRFKESAHHSGTAVTDGCVIQAVNLDRHVSRTWILHKTQGAKACPQLSTDEPLKKESDVMLIAVQNDQTTNLFLFHHLAKRHARVSSGAGRYSLARGAFPRSWGEELSGEILKNVSEPTGGAKYQVATGLYFPGGDLTAVFKVDVNNAVTEQSETDNSTSLFCIG